MIHSPHSHCSSCGTKYGNEDWPRVCPACTFTAWRNPFPVCVALVRVGHGILGGRRGIEPKKGGLALPGGYHNFGETWQEGVARELEEETGIKVSERGVRLFDALTSADGRFHVTFGTVGLHLAELPPLVQVPNHATGENETQELVILTGDETLAFPLHTEALRKFVTAILRG